MKHFTAAALLAVVCARAAQARGICEALKFLPATEVEQWSCNYSHRHAPIEPMCIQTQHILASYPASGSTLLRKLIENASGYYTGSVYNDHSLRVHFAGEGLVANCVAIKTHYLSGDWLRGKRDIWPRAYEQYVAGRVVYLVRNPLHAMLAEFKRREAATETRNPHTISQYVRQMNNTDENLARFSDYFARTAKKWVYHVVDILRLHAEDPSRVLIIHFEDMVHHREATLRDVLRHLKVPFKEAALRCALTASDHPELRHSLRQRQPHVKNALTSSSLPPSLVSRAERVVREALRVTKYAHPEHILELLQDHETSF